MILLNPGPANTTQSVKDALVCEDICPRERDFGDVQARVQKGLTRVVHDGDDFVAVLFGGSGTAAVEAAICSVVPPTGRLLVIDNGAYGTRMAQIAKGYQIACDSEALGVGVYPDLDRIEALLKATSYTHLAVVHHETSTGLLNPVEEIGALCEQNGVEMIVDAMSSYAGLPIDIAQMRARFLISSSNKCIQGMAGLGFVICHRASLERLASFPGRSHYFNLIEQHRFFEQHHQMRFTPPVQIMYALDQALVEFFAEGQENRTKRYRACFTALDEGVRELGFRRLLPDHMLSRILTAYVEPTRSDYSFDTMHDALYQRGYTIYPGKGAQQDTFRLANMGAITPDDMRGFVKTLATLIQEKGWRPLYP